MIKKCIEMFHLSRSGFRYTGHGMDLDKALSGCNPEAPVLLLAHQPKAAKKALDSKYNIQLVLSGMLSLK